MEQLNADPKISFKLTSYQQIIQLCKDQPPIPAISLDKSTKILKSLKKNVVDFFSVTALHYLHAGQEGLIHFNRLLNALISGR